MKKLILSTTIIIALFSATAFANDHNKNKKFGKHHAGNDKIYRQLDLSDTQKKQIQAIFRDVRIKENVASQRKAHQAFMNKRMVLIEAKTFDKAAAERLADEQFADMKSRFVMMAEAEHKAWQVLTPKQQQQAKKLMQKRQKRMQKRMEKRQERQIKQHDNENN